MIALSNLNLIGGRVAATSTAKVGVLALGMLTCMSEAFALMAEHKGDPLDLASIPAEDSRTYSMIRKADTIGTFQIESRMQMSMLQRLKPQTFYDLVIQIAIVRPGPIQGDMAHPYLRRREGKEAVQYASSWGQMPAPGRILRGALEFATNGVLCAGADHFGRSGAWR